MWIWCCRTVRKPLQKSEDKPRLLASSLSRSPLDMLDVSSCLVRSTESCNRIRARDNPPAISFFVSETCETSTRSACLRLCSLTPQRIFRHMLRVVLDWAECWIRFSESASFVFFTCGTSLLTDEVGYRSEQQNKSSQASPFFT